jgi:hypothetical protein
LKSKDKYLWFAGDDMDAFLLEEFFNNEKERKKCFEIFKNSNVVMDDYIQKIIQINMEKGS